MPPKNLFPDLFTLKTGREMRNYVAHRLAEMADEGTLFLTDCLNQGRGKAQIEAVRALVGDVIMGYDVGPDGYQRQGRPVPREVLNYRVKVRAITCRVQVDKEMPDLSVATTYVAKRKTIGWKDFPNIVGEAIDLATARATQDAYAQGQEWFEPNNVDTGELETELSTRDALLCLRQRGKNVKPAKSKRLQQFYWQVEEVRPNEQTAKEETPKAKPKRKRRTKAEMQAARAADAEATEGPAAPII